MELVLVIIWGGMLVNMGSNIRLRMEPGDTFVLDFEGERLIILPIIQSISFQFC